MIQDQRYHGDHTGKQCHDDINGSTGKEDGLASCLNPPEIGDAGLDQKNGFDKHADDAFDAHALAHHAIEGEEHREHRRDLGNTANTHGLLHHAGGDNRHHDLAPPVQPFAKHRHAKKKGDKRIDEIADHRIQQVPRLNGMDEHDPVHRQQRA